MSQPSTVLCRKVPTRWAGDVGLDKLALCWAKVPRRECQAQGVMGIQMSFSEASQPLIIEAVNQQQGAEDGGALESRCALEVFWGGRRGQCGSLHSSHACCCRKGARGRLCVEEFPAFLCIPSFSNTLLRTLKFFTFFSVFPIQPLPSTWYTPSSLGTLAQICSFSGLSPKPHLFHDKLPKMVCSFCFPWTLPLNL